MIGYDYTARIAPAALRAAGCTVAFRYTTNPAWPKSLTKPEASELLAAGFPIVCNFESTADRMLAGAPGGRADATELLGIWAALGAPAGLTGWFSADWDVQPTEVVLVLDYLGAAAEVLGSGRVGCYGGYRAVAAAADAGYPIWQTVAWSAGRWDPRAAARQTGGQLTVGGVTVDVNEIINLSALGAWIQGADGTMGTFTMSANWENDYPDVAAALAEHIPPGTYDETNAAGYAMVRAFVAAERAGSIETKLDTLLAKTTPVDPATIAAAVAAAVLPHIPAPTVVDAQAIGAAAAAVIEAHGLPAVDPAVLAEQLAGHFKVV